MTDKKSEYVLKKHAKLKDGRANWDSYWQELAEYIVPKKDNVYGSPVKGEKRENKLYTSVSVQANEDLASALHGMLTNPSSIWFSLSTGDEEIDKDVEVKAWIQEVVHIMITVMNNSNFQTQIHETYIDLGSFGTALLKVEEDEDNVLTFDARPVYEGFISEDHRGRVDTVSYEFRRTLKQIAQEFGMEPFEENEQLMRALEKDDMQEYTVIHLVEPRENYNPNIVATTSLPFASYKIIRETGTMLKESGFRENPYIVSRWSKISGETYGRSPGMKALSDIKMLNELQKYNLKGLAKSVDPAIQMPDDGFLLPADLRSGAINYYRSNSRDRIEPVLTGSRPDLGQAYFQDIEARIKQAFFIDKLQIREADRMTATEVMQRREEQLRSLGPILGRQHFELLRPLIDRVFNILARKELFPPAPSILQDRELSVEYTSQIARVQKTSETDSLTRVLNLIAPIANVQPEIMSNWNGDAITRDLHNKFGLPSEYLLSETDVEDMREKQAQQAAQQQEMERDQQEAEIINKVK